MISILKNLNPENVSIFYENIDFVFERLVRILNGSCGILVLKESADSFVEFTSCGYESDFYYSFLARGNGNFESITSSEEPVLFWAKEFSLSSPISSLAMTTRIAYKGEMFGFLLIEFPNEVNELQKNFLDLVADRIANLHAVKLNLASIPAPYVHGNQEKNINFELFDFILSGSIGFTNSLKANRFINIQGSQGSGKKSLVKYIYKKLDLHGKIVHLNSLPDQVGKLEKSIQDWIALSGNGILVIENISNLSMGQQRVFFEFIKEPVLEPRIIFLDDLTKHKEDYQPFWNLLAQHTVQLPNLLSLDKEKLKTVIDLLFKNLRQVNRRPDMTLSDDTYEFLFNYPYKENLRDLRNLLEQAVVTSKENIISKEFYLKFNNSKIKSLDFQNEEDLDLRKSVQALERQKILLANKIFSGNQIRMAKALGVSRGSLQYKMKQLEL
ncbi:MAG TPA: helix-turn-helix domain-containing protein [Leptospiraceae bacterium]|nr:helix-turn-helix domain-containing protein [Leptospiraceae bacterium]